MRTLLLLLTFCHLASTVKHSLKYFLTATSGLPDFPEFVGAAMVDGVLVGYCDSSGATARPKQAWMSQLTRDDPQHLEWYELKCLGNQQVFRANLHSLKLRLNQTGGVHILQRMNGCEWDDETGRVVGFNQYGYDGEDFIALDLQTLTWVAPRPEAFSTKLRWDTERARLDYNKDYYIHKCPEWLKKYIHYGRSLLQRTVVPSVSLLQKTSSSPVSCFATGFHPGGAALTWRRDGAELHEDVDRGEILPNHDGTFQVSAELHLSSVPPEDWSRYECVFQLAGLDQDRVTRLDRAAIQTNRGSPSGFPAGPVVGTVVGLLLLLISAGLVFIRRKSHEGFLPASRDDVTWSPGDSGVSTCFFSRPQPSPASPANSGGDKENSEKQQQEDTKPGQEVTDD